jgi:RimJ/RimL family protein N-acetyltransferase
MAFYGSWFNCRTGQAVGTASYRCINPAYGSIEVGGLFFSPRLQRTTVATEALTLMIRDRCYDF